MPVSFLHHFYIIYTVLLLHFCLSKLTPLCLCLSFSTSFLLPIHSLIQQYPSPSSPNNSAISPSYLIPSHSFAACSSVSISVSHSLQLILSLSSWYLFAAFSLPHLTLARCLVHSPPLFFPSYVYFSIPLVLISLDLVLNLDPSIFSF